MVRSRILIIFAIIFVLGMQSGLHAEAFKLSDSDWCQYPFVLPFENGKIMVAWNEWYNGDWKLFYRIYANGSWSAKAVIFNVTERCQWPQLDIDSKGTIHMIYMRGIGAYRKTYHGYYSNGTWVDAGPVNPNSNQNSTWPRISIDGSDNIHSIWGEDWAAHAEDNDIQHSYNSGGGWTSPVWINITRGTTSYHPGLDAKGSYQYAVWQDGNSPHYDIRFSQRQNGGGWSSPVILYETYGSWPNITGDNYGNVHVIWNHPDGSLYYKNRLAGSWGGYKKLNNAKRVRNFAWIEVDDDSNLYAAWRQGPVSGWENIAYSTGNRLGTFNTPQIIGKGLVCKHPIIKPDNFTKNVYVVWYDVLTSVYPDSEHGQVWFNSVNPLGQEYYAIAGTTKTFVKGEPGVDSDMGVAVLASNSTRIKEATKHLGGVLNDEGLSLTPTSDGGTVIGGMTISFTNGGSDFYIFKMGADGSKLWGKNYGGTGNEWGCMVQETKDKGFIISGMGDSFSNGEYDLLVFKTDSAGNKIWRKNFGGLNNEEGGYIQQTSDGGYILLGYSNTFTNGGYDFIVYRLDSSGNKIWSKNYGGSADDKGISIQQTTDGGYIMIGTTESYTNGGKDILVYKLDASGNVTWKNNYGGTLDDEGYFIEQTSDGGYILVGNSLSFTNGGLDILVFKTNQYGTKEWRQNYGTTGNEGGYMIRETQGNGYVIVGVTDTDTRGGTDSVTYKLDNSGAVLWKKTLGGIYDESTYYIQTIVK